MYNGYKIGILFNGHKKVQMRSESVINWPPGSVIRNYGSAGSGSERNIYGSGTLRVKFTLCERNVLTKQTHFSPVFGKLRYDYTMRAEDALVKEKQPLLGEFYVTCYIAFVLTYFKIYDIYFQLRLFPNSGFLQI